MCGDSRQQQRPGVALPWRQWDVKASKQRSRGGRVVIDTVGSATERQAGIEIPGLPCFPFSLKAWNALAEIVKSDKRANAPWHCIGNHTELLSGPLDRRTRLVQQNAFRYGGYVEHVGKQSVTMQVAALGPEASCARGEIFKSPWLPGCVLGGHPG